MRLSPHQRQVLTQTARDCFDPAVQVRQFGSRADDARKGGDIDLLIETQLQDPAQIARAHTQFLARVYMALGEQKIDRAGGFVGPGGKGRSLNQVASGPPWAAQNAAGVMIENRSARMSRSLSPVIR